MFKRISVLAAILMAALASQAPATTKQLAILMTAPTLSQSPMACIEARIGKYILLTTGNGAVYTCTAAGWTPITDPAGAVPAGSVTAGVTVAEGGTSGFHKTVFTLTNVSITMTDATTAGNHGKIQLYDFPAGHMYILGATTNLTTAAGTGGISDTAALVGAVGSVAVATDNATLLSTEADFVPSTTGTLTGGAGTLKGKSTATEHAVADGTSAAKDAYLNFAVPDAGSTGNDTLTVNGTVTLLWVQFDDN